MESVFCPQCGDATELDLEMLARMLRCSDCNNEYMPLAQVPENVFESEVIDCQVYTFCTPEVYAIGYFCENDEFAVVRGSKFSCYQDEDLSSLYTKLRTELIDREILVMDADGHHFTLTESYSFDDHHTAASLVAGQDEDGDLAWDVSEGEEEEDDGELDDECEYDQGNTESSGGTHFLDFSREQIRQLIVDVLEQRPNNSVKKDALVSEIFRHMGVRSSGWTRLQFTNQVMLEVQWLARQKVLKRYTVKNNRGRLTEFYRTQLLLTSNMGESDPAIESNIQVDSANVVLDTMEALKAENARLRKIIAMLALEGVPGKGQTGSIA